MLTCQHTRLLPSEWTVSLAGGERDLPCGATVEFLALSVRSEPAAGASLDMRVCLGTISGIGSSGLLVPFTSDSDPSADSTRAGCRCEDTGTPRLMACFGRDGRRSRPSCRRRLGPLAEKATLCSDDRRRASGADEYLARAIPSTAKATQVAMCPFRAL